MCRHEVMKSTIYNEETPSWCDYFKLGSSHLRGRNTYWLSSGAGGPPPTAGSGIFLLSYSFLGGGEDSAGV